MSPDEQEYYDSKYAYWLSEYSSPSIRLVDMTVEEGATYRATVDLNDWREDQAGIKHANILNGYVEVVTYGRGIAIQLYNRNNRLVLIDELTVTQRGIRFAITALKKEKS